MIRSHMKSTKYITGKSKEFFEPEATALATKRIKACKELMQEIAKRRRENELEPDDIDRYLEAQASVDWWTELLESE